ncbi:hypothetical protein PQR15_27965 [Streptomyces lydicus]|nr:hypothetical protein [Streptomyces lydicus]
MWLTPFLLDWGTTRTRPPPDSPRCRWSRSPRRIPLRPPCTPNWRRSAPLARRAGRRRRRPRLTAVLEGRHGRVAFGRGAVAL